MMNEIADKLYRKARFARNQASICVGAATLNTIFALGSNAESSVHVNGILAALAGGIAVKGVLDSKSFDGQANALVAANQGSLAEPTSEPQQ